jgi:GMP synthase-like glutamine amidotransferase
MIVYIIADKGDGARRHGGYQSHKVTLEDVSEDVCLVLHYTQVSLARLADLRPWAVCHSGSSTDFSEYDVLEHPGYQGVIREWDGPQIGFCGGHQIMAHSFGSVVARMGKVRPGEADHNPGYRCGYYKQWGVYPVTIVQRDPLFKGMGRTIRVQEYHSDEVKKLGPDLVLLASSARCRVQVFRHRCKPLYGTQFHPEQSPEAYPDGRRVLRNFFALARQHGAATDRDTRTAAPAG